MLIERFAAYRLLANLSIYGGTLLLEGMVVKEDVEKAITDMEWMRQTHIDWAEHFEKHPRIEAEYVATGQWDGASEHRRIAAMYDRVIELLQTLLK